MLDWLIESDRWKHLVLAICIGLWANTWYCTEYTAAGVSGAMELKDLQWGGKWDWVDFLLTIAGFNAGFALRTLIIS